MAATAIKITQKRRATSKYAAYPRVVMVTMVYQNDAGMEVKVLSSTLW